MISEEKSILNVSRDPARVSLPLTLTKTVTRQEAAAAESRHPRSQNLASMSADDMDFPPSVSF